MIYFLFFLDGNKEEYTMEHVRYLIIDEIVVLGKENNCRYKTLHSVESLEGVWSQEVRIVDPYGGHELAGYYPDNWDIYDEEVGESPVPGYRYPKYYARVLKDDSVWDHFKYNSWGDDPQEVRVFRKVYELKGGELPVLGHITENRYAW